jgi:hypothetical protein
MGSYQGSHVQVLKGASSAYLSRQLLQRTIRKEEDGLVTSGKKVGKLMLDSMIVEENISSNSGRCRTRSYFAVQCYSIELRHILTRLVVVVSSSTSFCTSLLLHH